MLRELVYILIKDPLSPHSGPTLGMHEELCGDSGIVLGLYFKDPLSPHSGPTLGMHEELGGESGTG